MSCPDWRVLREDEAPHGARQEALRHLADCASCRRDALAVDPTLIFSIASARSDDAPASPPEAIERMRERVAGARAMRQASAASWRTSAASWRERWSTDARRLAAAVLLPLAGVGLIALGADRAGDGSRQAAESARTRPAASHPVDPLLADALSRLPLIEGAAPVSVQEEGNGYDLVMVVDAGLEL